MTDPGQPHERAPTSNAILAGALLTLELVAGLQANVLITVVPLVGADLHAQQYYGVITAAPEVAMFVTMPLGPYLLHRVRVERLLLWLVIGSVAGGIVSALAPSVGVFVLGRAVVGLATGAQASVSLSAVVVVLPPAWRRAVLTGYNVVWVLISFLAPLYAGLVVSTLDWRWALVGYLPLLVAARIVAARQLRGSLTAQGSERLMLGSALVLAGGIALLSATGVRSLSPGAALIVGGAGAALVLAASARLLPAGTLALRGGRPAAVATMGLATGAFFGAEAIMAIIVHDLMGASTGEVTAVVAAGGFGWSLAGLAAGRWPATAPRRYLRRAGAGALLMAVGMLGSGAGLLTREDRLDVAIVICAWAIAGVGMGLVYLDTLNHIVDVGVEVDGVAPTRAAAAAVLAEAISAAVPATLTTAAVGRSVAGGAGVTAALTCLVLCAAAALGVAAGARRTLKASPRRPVAQTVPESV